MLVELKIMLFLLGTSFCFGQSQITPLKVNKGELIFLDDFERHQIGTKWDINKKFNGAFSINKGVFIGKEIEGAGHGSVARTHFNFSDVVIEFDLMFNGAKRVNIVMDDSLCKTVWSSHISRVSFSKSSIKVQDDKTGIMNLDIRNQIKDNPKRNPELTSFLSSKMNTKKFEFKNEKWYHIVITKVGDVLECKVNDTIVQLKSEGIAHPNLNKFGPTITGGEIRFDNFRVWTVK